MTNSTNTANSSANSSANSAAAVNDANSSANDNKPVTYKQFFSFEKIAIAAFSFAAILCSYVWTGHAEEFKTLKSDVKAISLVIPTLATKDEMNAMEKRIDKKIDTKFEKMDDKFEKMDDKLDKLIASVTTIANTLTTQVAINSYKIDQLAKGNKITPE